MASYDFSLSLRFSFSVETAGEELRLHIEGGRGGLKHDQERLHEAEPAGLCHRVVGRGPADDAPGDGVRDLSAVEVSHISAYAFPVGSILRVVGPDVVHVAVPSRLECAASQAGVVLGGSCVLPGDHGSVDDRLHSPVLVCVTLAWLGALTSLAHLAVALGHDGVLVALAEVRLDLGVVAGDDLVHILHCSV